MLVQRVLLICLTLVLVCALPTARPPRALAGDVYIAFGFHGNLYHSFRNDTNDEFGFGKDIRIIRHIIATLDRFNQQGVPVRAAWDFDNLFSLQEILPQYAPDILTDIRRRIHQQGDEAIIMSYNNGLVSAMTREEFTKAMRWAIANPRLSGVKDVFGAYSPIVRPQEMMTTPGSFRLYKQLGLQAVALYYSATPFDAFRVFSRRLTPAEAHNPILYENPQTNETITLIPSYHIGDLVEHVSLRHWAQTLRARQADGTLPGDALIFLNFDADAEFWTGVDLPRVLKWLPNTNGLAALVEEVKDLPYVHFTTPGAYLQSHPPAGSVSFNQDTADGSFDGYNSWAEKARSPSCWTAIQRSRRIQAAARKAMALLGRPPALADLPDLLEAAENHRLRALSTTNFGMATPFLSRQREEVVAVLMAQLTRDSDAIQARVDSALKAFARQQPAGAPPPGSNYVDTLVLLPLLNGHDGSSGRFISLPLPQSAFHETGNRFWLESPSGKRFEAVSCDASTVPGSTPDLKLYLTGNEPMDEGVFHLFCRRTAKTQLTKQPTLYPESPVHLANSRLDLRFDRWKKVAGVWLDGARMAGAGSLMPYVHYADRTIAPEALELKEHDPASATLTGYLIAPPDSHRTAGKMAYTYTLVEQTPYLRVHGSLRYPATYTRDTLKSGEPGLMRRADMHWRETAPAEIRFTPTSTRAEPVRVLKHNFLGIDSHYAIDYFRHSPQNLNVDNANNHITNGYVGVLSGGCGLAVAMDTTVLANFAFAPLKVIHDPAADRFAVRVNPFGTYHGRQYRPPTDGNGQGFEMTLITGEHLYSAAPTYNGVSQTFDLLVAFFTGDRLPPQVKADLLAFAHPPYAVSLSAATCGPSAPLPLKPPTGFVAAYRDGAVQFNWDTGLKTDGHYRIYCGTRPGYYQKVFTATGSFLRIQDFAAHAPFTGHHKFYACIQAVSAENHTSSLSREIRLRIEPDNALNQPDIPLSLKLKVLWSNLRALLGD